MSTLEFACWAAIVLVGMLLCTSLVFHLIRKAPITDDYDDEIDRVQRIIASAKHHRERLEAIEHELIELHCIDPPVPEIAEVLHDDPDPEWTDELIRLCNGLISDGEASWSIGWKAKIRDHLAKRGEK